MANTTCTLLTFEDISDALAFESLAKERALPGRLIPIPHALSAGCGMAWTSPQSAYDCLEKALNTASTIDAHLFLFDSTTKEIITDRKKETR